MTKTELMGEAREFAKTYFNWFNNSSTWYRGADIFRRDDGTYRLISSGCGINGIHNVVTTNVSSDMFGDCTGEISIDSFAESLVDSGYMADILRGTESE